MGFLAKLGVDAEAMEKLSNPLMGFGEGKLPRIDVVVSFLIP